MMKKSLLALAAVATIGLTAASSASATAVYLNNGVDYSALPIIAGNGSTKTSAITSLGFAGTLATSIYLGDPSIAGTSVIDTNRASVMTSYGFTANPKLSIPYDTDPGPGVTIGQTAIDVDPATAGVQNPNFPQAPGQTNIDTLNSNAGTPDFNGFTLPPYGQIGTSWGLTYDYTILGKTTGPSGGASTGIEFTSGDFKLYYEDGTNKIQVMELNLTGSTLAAPNLNLFGNVSFGFVAGLSPAEQTFVQNFWENADGGLDLYDAWLANPANGVSWTLNTNVVPPVPTPDQLWLEAGGLFRQSTLAGSIAFDVPEPGSLALLGIGLAGLGFAQRSRKLKAG